MRAWWKSYEGETVLALGAHPDDVEIAAGGTVARLVEAGARVTMVAVCAPDRPEERKRELEEAAAVLGARPVLLDGTRPLRVEDLRTYELVTMIDAVIRQWAPAALFTHSAHETHWDHVLLSRAVTSSLRLRRLDVFHFAPPSCRNVVGVWHPQLWVDISSTVEKKLAAIAAHRSQFASRGLDVELFREQARIFGHQSGYQYAEGLEVVRLDAP